MPQTGGVVPFVQTVPATSSQFAEDNIPRRQLYSPSMGAPEGSMNEPATNEEGNFDFSSYTGSGSGGFDNLANTIAFLNQNVQGSANQTQSNFSGAAAVERNFWNDQSSANRITQDLVTNVQLAIDNNQDANSALFGFQSIADGNQGIWNWNSSVTFFNPVDNLLVNAAAGGAILMSQKLHRLVTSTSFLVWLNFCEESQGFPDVENLNAAVYQDLAPGADVLTFLQGVLPDYPWEDNHNGTGLVGMDWTSEVDGIPRGYYWSPPPPTMNDIFALLQFQSDDLLDRFFHLWDYTPSSGPPTRNGITDMILVLSMLPFTR